MNKPQNAHKFIKKIKIYMYAFLLTMKTIRYSVNCKKTFRLFITIRNNQLLREPLTWFHLKELYYCIRPIDWYVMESIVLDDEYWPIKRMFQKNAPKLIIDAGAHIGMFSLYVLSLWSSVEVYAFEASPETFSVLKKNYEANKNYNWNVHNYALWEKDGEVPFETSGLSLAWHISKTKNTNLIPAISFESLIKMCIKDERRISLLKMDIEGAEEVVLLSSQHILDRVDSILIEVHRNMCNETTVMDILKDKFGYLYDISGSSTPYSVILASHHELSDVHFQKMQR